MKHEPWIINYKLEEEKQDAIYFVDLYKQKVRSKFFFYYCCVFVLSFELVTLVIFVLLCCYCAPVPYFIITDYILGLFCKHVIFKAKKGLLEVIYHSVQKKRGHISCLDQSTL